MGSYLLKCDPDVDFYVEWSDGVEAPTAWGPRAELERYQETLGRRDMRLSDPLAEQELVIRFARADASGSSALWPSRQDPVFGWADRTLIYEQRGILPRASLRALCEALERGDREAAWDLLSPFEDGREVYRG